MRVALLMGLLVACGPKLDPLHPLKAELAQARRAGPTAAPPHVRATLATSAINELIQLAVANPKKPIIVPVMLGTSAVVRPTLQPPAIALQESPDCDCPRVHVELDGQVDVELAGLMGRRTLADDLEFEAVATGSSRISLDRDEERNTVIALAPVESDPWDVSITIAEPQGMINDELIAAQVSGPLAEQLKRSIPLASLPPTTPVQPARIEIEVAADPTAAVWLQGRPSEPAPAVEVDEGWAVATTEDGALAITRAAFAGLEQPGRWKIEPIGLQIDDDSWTVEVRVHKVARRSKYRDYRLSGPIIIGETIPVTVNSTERIAKGGWGISLVSLFVDGRVRKQAASASLEIPAIVQRNINGTPIRFRVLRIDSPGSDVFIYGRLEPGEPDAE